MENKKLKIIFFGNTRFSLIGAKIIHEHLGLSHIVTLPDRPDKRGRITPNPMKLFAQKHHISFSVVEKLTKEAVASLIALAPDFLIVEDYGLILPKNLLDSPKYASLNIHHSLLPKYRGSSPAPFAILAGDTVTGVSIITMAEKVDTGDILAQKTYTIKPAETTESLLIELNKLGGQLIIPVIKDFDQVKPQPQDESLASYTKQFIKEDGYIDLSEPPESAILDRMIRAYYPWPTVWTKWKMRDGQWRIIKFLPDNTLQVEGKNPVSVRDFLNGYPEMKEIITKLFPYAVA